MALPFAFALFLNKATYSPPIEEWIKQMTLEEKVSLCNGGDSMFVHPIPRLGIPEWKMNDGPHGVRQDVSTGFPTGVCLASTWNPDLALQEGTALGEETRATGNWLLLGPAINIDRTPLGGRDFEYMSEDPWLVSKLVVPYIQGVQKHVGACVKHFAANSQETERDRINANVSERALREIYLPGFEAAVTIGGAASVMAAYNKVQGLWCAENPHLLTDILKNEWGFKGAVISDWGATHSTIPSALAGLDVEMPGPGTFFRTELVSAVKSGKVAESVIDDKARRVLTAMAASHVFDKPAAKVAKNTKAHQNVALKVAEEGIVLLKNSQNVLPLDTKKIRSIALIGPAANFKFCRGGGSSEVRTPYELTILDGLKESVGNGVKINFAPGMLYENKGMQPVPSSRLRNLKATYWNNMTLTGDPVFTESLATIDKDWNGSNPGHGIGNYHFSMRATGAYIAQKTGTIRLALNSDDGSRLYVNDKLIINSWSNHAEQVDRGSFEAEQGHEYNIRLEYYQDEGGASLQLLEELPPGSLGDPVRAARESDVAIVCVGTNHDYDSEGHDKPDMNLMPGQDELVQQVVAANPRTIVVLVNGSPLDIQRWSVQVPAIVEAWYPGQEGGRALAHVLLGQVNPSGKLPVTFPVQLSDSPAHANGNFPGSGGQLAYDEDILVGYRWFDTKRVAPTFPFGHGLSYTSFEYSDLNLRRDGSELIVRFKIRNRGLRSGAEVAQVYLHSPGNVKRPEQELKGFAKVFLKAGDSREVSLRLSARDFSYYGVEAKRWAYEEGRWEIRVGSSSRDIRLKGAEIMRG